MIKIKSEYSEFVILYDVNYEEITVFQSDNIEELEKSVNELLDYLQVDHEWINK